jgi:hypothetical protein
MDIKTKSVDIRGTSDAAGAVINALCDFGTLEAPRVPDTAEKWSALRLVRDELLVLSDWSQFPDVALSIEEKSAWAAYRQTLRDIPQDFATPEEVTFPTPPNGGEDE